MDTFHCSCLSNAGGRPMAFSRVCRVLKSSAGIGTSRFYADLRQRGMGSTLDEESAEDAKFGLK